MIVIKTYKKSLGKVIRKQRRALRMSQTELASHSNITQPHLSEIEHGEINAYLSSYNRIAYALGLKPSALFMLADSPQSKKNIKKWR